MSVPNPLRIAPPGADGPAAGDEVFFRPPSEADSFIIRVMRGCSHNKCSFCNMFKGIPFRVLPLEEIKAGIEKDALSLGPKFLPLLTSLYMEGGDPLVMTTDKLLAVMAHARAFFPALERVVCYATARSILKKTPAELKELAKAGLRRVFVGLESGSDSVLMAVNKGCTRADLLRAGELLASAGIGNDVSIMLGIGGYELSERHAVDSAELLSRIKPACVRIRTFVPCTGTPLGDDYLAGRFSLMTPPDILRELALMLEHISAPMRLLSEHWSDFIFFDASLPEDREALQRSIAKAVLLPPDAFRPLGIKEARG